MSGVFGNPWLYNADDSFYPNEITNSVRMSDASNSSLQWTAGTPTSSTTWTMSVWMKKWNPNAGQAANEFFSAGTGGATYSFFGFTSNQYFVVENESSGTKNKNYNNRKFRDPSAWFHLVLRSNLSESTQDDRLRLYINGELQTSTSDGITQTSWAFVNANNVSQNWGGKSGIANGNEGCDFYLADVNFCDGQSYDPTKFGELKDNIWIPVKPSVVYGDNGYRLEFKQTGTGADANGIGADTSGKGNHFSVSGIVASDVVPDSPTNNFATLNELFNSVSQAVLSEGNLKASTAGFTSSAYGYGATSTFAIPKDKKIYIEVECTDTTGDNWFCGFATKTSIETGVGGNTGSDGAITCYNRSIKLNGTEIDYGSSAGLGGLGVAKLAAGDILGCMCDGATGKVWFSRNGTYFKTPTTDDSGTTGDPSGGNHEIGTLTGGTTDDVFFVLGGGTAADDIFVNFGQDSTNVASAQSDANGIGTFEYAPPTDYLSLCSASITTASIGPQGDSLAEDYFDVALWTGNGGTQSISTLAFKPSFVFLKNRNQANDNPALFDSVRGESSSNYYRLEASGAGTSQLTGTAIVSSLNSNGFTLGGNGQGNTNGRSFVGWSWLAGSATPSKSYKVVVVSDSGNKYRFRNSADDTTFASSAVTLDLQEGGTYVFDWSDGTAQGHPIRFSTTSDGTHGGGSEYTTGVVKDDSAYTTTITVESGAPALYYYCQIHSGMGGAVNTNSTYGSTNFDGTLLSVATVNESAGFSILKYTGNLSSSGTASVGHGLSAKPEMVISKSQNVSGADGGNWSIWFNYLTNNNYILLFNSSAKESNKAGNGDMASLFTAKTFGTNYTSGLNVTGNNYIAYCFHSVDQYCKVGSFEGNSSADGTFVFCNFRPKLIIIKGVDQGSDWAFYDDQREGYNPDNDILRACASAQEQTDDDIDILSNGFKLRRNSPNFNQSTLVFIAWASQPFKFSNAR